MRVDLCGYVYVWPALVSKFSLCLWMLRPLNLENRRSIVVLQKQEWFCSNQAIGEWEILGRCVFKVPFPTNVDEVHTHLWEPFSTERSNQNGTPLVGLLEEVYCLRHIEAKQTHLTTSSTELT